MSLKLIDIALSLIRCCHWFVNANAAKFVLINIIVNIINDASGFDDICEEQCLNSYIIMAVITSMLEVLKREIKINMNAMFVTNACGDQ